MESDLPDNLKLTASAIIMVLGDLSEACLAAAWRYIADAKGIPFMMLIGAILMIVTVIALRLKRNKQTQTEKNRMTISA
jgi:hypothetical protein